MKMAPFRPRIHILDSGLDEVLQAELDFLRVYRPLIVTDESAALASLIDECLEGVSAASAETAKEKLAVYRLNETAGMGDARAISRRLFTEGRDGLIVFGGRNSIDTCKYAAREFARVRPDSRHRQADERMVPVIVVPDSPADGAGLRAVVRMVDADGHHQSFQDDSFLPSVLICDTRAYATLDVTSAICAEFDVVVHCIETLARSRLSPPAKGMAIDGLRRAWRILKRRASGVQTFASGETVFSAAVNAALAEDGGLGAIHALALAIEEERHDARPHGYYHAAVFKPVMSFNAPAMIRVIPEIEEAMECSGGVPGIVDMVSDVAARLGLPVELNALGLDPAARARIACAVSGDVANTTNPRRVRKADYKAILCGGY
jgi:alcohol dehydrogenase class IV